MNLKGHPTEIADTLLTRSICAVQVAAVLVDGYGIFAWGWNGSGPTGYGQHAEDHCLHRSNLKRAKRATMYVAARRKRNGKIVTAKPCEECQRLLPMVGGVIYRDGDGEWKGL